MGALNVPEIVRTKVHIDPKTKCWNWIGSFSNKGYGRVGKNTEAYRVIWRYYKGEIPKGAVLDHLCRNKKCVNPDHFRLTNNATNSFHGFVAKNGQMSRKHIRMAVLLHDQIGPRIRGDVDADL